MQDRTLGIFGLSFSVALLGGLFLKLIVLPNVPIGEEQESNLSTSITLVILAVCGLFGFVFVGFLVIFTAVVVYKNSKEERCEHKVK